MRILIISKRQYMGKDLLSDKYGRFYEIPRELAKIGHSVFGVALSYRPRDEGEYSLEDFHQSQMIWHSYNLKRLFIPGRMNHFYKIRELVNEFRPEIIFACSDSFHAIFGRLLSKRLEIPYVVDLYDNFESFPATKLPGVISFFKQAVKDAAGVSCISEPLKAYLEKKYKPKGKIITLENGVRTDLFYKMDKVLCRRRLGLPLNGKIIGTAGALHKNRGIEELFNAFKKISAMNNNSHLVLAGRLDQNVSLPKNSHVHYLGELPYEEIPYLINTFDVGIICNRDSAFGRYCFPQKAYEMIACGIPVVAASVGVMKSLLRNYPFCMYEPGNQESLRVAVEKQLRSSCVPEIDVRQWVELARRLESLFIKVVMKD